MVCSPGRWRGEGESLRGRRLETFPSTTAAKRAGSPCLQGMRIRAVHVLDLLAAGVTKQEILEDWPDLEVKNLEKDRAVERKVLIAEKLHCCRME